MKKLIIPVILLCAVVFYYAASGQDKAQIPEYTASVRPLPESLDNLFPPKAEAPLFLIQMHTMATSLMGLYSDIIQNDTQNINSDFDDFMSEYVKSSKMVPEWNGYFSMDPVNELGIATKSGNPDMVNAAFGKTAGVCENCHNDNMVRVQQKYHWDDFEQITLTDPLTNQDVPFQQMMLFMDVSFSGISKDVEQGQNENAQASMAGFAARFNTVTESCAGCHDTERKYFIDENIMQMIDQLQAAVSQPQIDKEAVAEIQESIGTESCFKCHLVHVPAAFSKHQKTAPNSTR